MNIASLLVLLGFLAVPAPADTSVSGTITTTTWTKANSPYRVTATLTVPTGETLTIEPGVDMAFKAGVPLVVDGRLLALGTEQDSIRFLLADTAAWGGVQVYGEDTSAIAFARISGASDAGLYAFYTQNAPALAVIGSFNGQHRPRLHIRRSMVSGNDGDGVWATDMATAWLDTCDVRDNRGSGIVALLGRGVIIDRPTRRTDGTPSTFVSVRGGRVAGNGGSGVQSVGAGGTFLGCTVEGNAETGVFAMYIAGAIELDSCVVRNNGFGVSATAGTAILDRCAIVDNEGYGVWLTSGHFYEDVTLSITFCTISGNGGSEGDAVTAEYGPGSLTVENSIVWGVLDLGTHGYATVPGAVTVAYSLLQGDTLFAGPGNLNADPRFVDPEHGDYRLAWGSPSIDSGDPASPLDADGTRADMGAYPFDHSTAVVAYDRPVPFALAQNYPNPFNPSTRIKFTMPSSGIMSLGIYDVNGRPVRTLVDGWVEPGMHDVVWDGTDAAGRPVASGVYLYRMTSGYATVVRKMVLLR